MTLFVDTSGILALIDRDDPVHAGTREAFGLGRAEPLATHAYVVVETLAVARRRFGAAVAADIIDRVLPAIEITPVDAELHATALIAFRESIGSSVSLVDRTSFAFMRREGITRAIALDADFRRAGFETLP
ncbi:MAG: PIN domain-containing protein [Chloroflexota bacterium]